MKAAGCATDRNIAENTDTYDDCGVAVKSGQDEIEAEPGYPLNIDEFMYGFYNKVPQSLKDLAGIRSSINHLATEVEEDANRLAAETQVTTCEVHALEQATDFLKHGFAEVAKRASEMAETATDNAYLYEAIAAVSALMFGVMANEEQQEQATIESLEVLEHDFETVGEVAELIRESTADNKSAPKLGGY